MRRPILVSWGVRASGHRQGTLQTCKPNDGLHYVVHGLERADKEVFKSVSRMTAYTVSSTGLVRVLN